MDSFIETFHIDWKIIIAQSINFIVVMFILYFLALKPLKKMMKERTENITKGLEDSKTNNELLIKTKEEYNKIISEAKTEAYELFQNGKKETENKKNKILKSASKEVEDMISSGKKVLEEEKAKMIEEARKEISSLVIKATEKLLESRDNRDYDEKTLNQIKKM